VRVVANVSETNIMCLVRNQFYGFSAYVNFTCRDAETGEFYHIISQPIPSPDLISLAVEVSYTIYYNCICTTFKLSLKDAA